MTFLNSVDPDQLASELIWICTVCHSVYKFIYTRPVARQDSTPDIAHFDSGKF